MTRLSSFHIRFWSTIFLLAACSPSSVPEPSQEMGPVAGPVVPLGQPEILDTGPTIEVVWNCGSGGGTVSKNPSRSVSTGYAVQWGVGSTTGIGLTIGQGVIPGGVELTSSLEGHYANQLDQGVQQGTGWDLPAGENTIVTYTIMWRELWQNGYVDVTLVDKSVVRVNVKYRTGFLSDITGKEVQVCDQQQIQPTAMPANTLIPSGLGTWLYNMNGLPTTGSQISWDLNAGEVLILTGGRIRYGDFYCGDSQYQICVLVIHASSTQTITITDLIAQNNWLAVSSTMSSEQALSEVQNLFWRPPNCEIGCSKATVAFFEDKSKVDTQVIRE